VKRIRALSLRFPRRTITLVDCFLNPRIQVFSIKITTQMEKHTIAFIGGGNMGRSLIGGLIADGFDAARIRVAEPDGQRRDALAGQFGIIATSTGAEAVSDCNVVVLAVKPQVMQGVARELGAHLHGKPVLVISVAAGIRESALERWLGGGLAIVRAMPNTPALVQSGATALHANPRVSREQRSLAESVLRAVGLTVWLEDEAQMDAVTALSGSGPAYIFLVMEAMEQAGRELGLAPETARLLTLQTAFGAAKMALETSEDTRSLREHVTSPGGTTEQALKVLMEGDIQQLFTEALKAAHRRAVELAEQLGERDHE